MSKINKHTYEAYFIDYTEGNLSETDKQELLLFLEQNPELKEELEAYEAIALPAAEYTFTNKEALKKPVYTDEVLVAYLENDLDEAQRKELEKTAAEHAYIQKEIDLYKKTILVPDAAIVYADKEKLKKRGPVLIWNNPLIYFRAAAAILLMLGLYVLISKQVDSKDFSMPYKEKVAAVSKNKTVPNTMPADSTKNNMQTLASIQTQRIAVIKTKSIQAKKQEAVLQNNSINNVANATHIENQLQDSIQEQHALVNTFIQNKTQADTSQAINKIALQETTDVSYFNHSTDIENDESIIKQEPADASKTKKSFFDVIATAVKGAKKLGVKDVDVKESKKENTVRIGAFAFSETVSN